MKTEHRILKIILTSIFTFSLFMLNSCSFYQKVSIKINDQDPWDEAMAGKPLIINPAGNINVLSENGQYQYELQNYVIEGSVLKGELVKITGFPIPERKVFRSVNIPNKERKKFLRTLYVTSQVPLEEGHFSINITDASELRRYTNAAAVNFAANLGIGAAVLIAGTAAIVAVACNCPRVYTLDAEGNQHLQGTLFTGAMSKSFERQDLLPLSGIDRNLDEVVIKVLNELPEDEYINELQLFKVGHRGDYQIGMDVSEELFEFNKLLPPQKAISMDGFDLGEKVTKLDKLAYEFEGNSYSEELNSAVFTFDRSQLTPGKLKLVVHARQTEWLEMVSESYFRLHGTDFNKVNKRMDKIPVEMYNRNMAKQGISMNAYLMTENGWSRLGTFKNAGNIKKRFLGMDIDLDNISGEEITIKLEAAFRFWELDQIGITQDWKMLDDYQEVPLRSATNESGQDVSALIQTADNYYAVQPDKGSFIDLKFDNNAKEGEIYVLQGTGYYYHRRDYTHPPQKKAIRAVKSNGKLAAHELSYLLYQYSTAVANSNN